MKWLIINEDYLNYLRQYEQRIPFSDYGNDRYNPFFGVLFETKDFYYVTQVSHPKIKHNNMKNNMDFKKIFLAKTNRFVAVINLNYMFPIPKYMYEELKYKDIEQHRSFENDIQKSKYINLMKMELKVINSMNLSKDAKKIYENKYKNPNNNISKRCIDFKTMEKLALKYNSKSSM